MLMHHNRKLELRGFPSFFFRYALFAMLRSLSVALCFFLPVICYPLLRAFHCPLSTISYFFSRYPLSAIRYTLPLLFLLTVSCDYARMRDQESVRTYEKQMPGTADNTIPVDGGYQILAQAKPASLKNPIPSSKQSIERGRRAYAYFCLQCHGQKLNGYGTVGQSFAPLPTGLTSPDVLKQSDGELYFKIRMGFNRHPPLYTTVSDRDTWAVINYLRALAVGGQKR